MNLKMDKAKRQTDREAALAVKAEFEAEGDHSESLDNFLDALDDIDALEAQVDSLTEWKRQQLQVEDSWDPQEVARVLGLPLGSDIRKGILPRIEALKAQVARLSKALSAAEGFIEDELATRRQSYLPETSTYIDEAASLLAVLNGALAELDAPTCDGIGIIAAERRRQIEQEGWSPGHDDEHLGGELIMAARAYAWAALCEVRLGAGAGDLRMVPNDWPTSWDKSGWKPSDDPVRNLAKVGALIAADIDRLHRRS